MNTRPAPYRAARCCPVLYGCVAATFLANSMNCAFAHEQLRVYFGNLHAHSNASDGNKDISPADAYRIAREEGGLDFLSLSEHNHIMADQAAYDVVIAAANAATTETFVALFGQEFSTINTGFNHANIQNYPVRIPPTLNGRYRQVFSLVLPTYMATQPNALIVGEFNHPDHLDTDYGLESDYGGDFAAFVADMDPVVQLIAVASGPADANNKSFIPTASQRFVHQNISTARWFEYLAQGMHLAPKIDHDSHSPTYGFRHAGRTAVWITDGITRDKLLRALAARHCYATEDKNLSILPTLTSGLPGDILPHAGDTTVSVTLTLSDSDEPQATYIIEVFSGASDGHPPSRVDALTATRAGDGPVTLSLPAPAEASLFHVIHVQQTSPDPVNGSTRDDAWLAPIWLVPAAPAPPDGPIDDVVTQAFVSSRNSEVYHFPECRVVQQIKPENLLHHEGPPAGKRLHEGCPLQ